MNRTTKAASIYCKFKPYCSFKHIESFRTKILFEFARCGYKYICTPSYNKMKTTFITPKKSPFCQTPAASAPPPNSIPILGPHVIRKRLRLLIIMMAVIMVTMWIVRRAHIFHLVDAAAFGASLDGAVTGCLEYLSAVFERQAVGRRDRERMDIEEGLCVCGSGRHQ